ncbi:HAD-IA family hydrolase [Streptococcus nidrosiense]|uniref:HAD-IA family hydrolase n=1 Tax=Streptococcus nidrosiense TaxID=3140788 RepID=UPI001CAA61D4|nr:HAD-IA family hydrolase [Streptococcus sp. LPB0406]
MEVFDISQIKTKIVAFDFFDTVVHRNCHPEQTLYQWAKEMALELNFDVSPAILYQIRKSVENNKELGTEEMCYTDLLSGIYDKIKDKIKILSKEEFIHRAKTLELKIELQHIYLDSKIQEVLKRLKSDSKQIILVSDFYTDKELIETVLKKFEILDYFSSIYISSEKACRKSTGNLYKLILKELGLKPIEITMIGDNYKSDYEVPRSLGLNAIYRQYIDKNTTVAEKELVRLYNQILFSNSKKAPFNIFLADIVFFISKLHKKMIQDDVQIALFCSREGQLLKRLFDIYQDTFFEKNQKICTEYFYVSRRSTLYSSFTSLEDEEFEMIFRQYKKITLQNFLLNLNFSDNEIILICQDLKEKPTYVLTVDDHLLEKLKKHPQFITKFNKEKKDSQLLRDYIERLTKNQNEVYLVDVGWKGTIQDSIKKALPDKRIVGYYLGLMLNVYSVENKTDKTGLLFSDYPNKSEFYDIVSRNFEFYEDIFVADHGPVLKYKKDSEIIPILEDDKKHVSIYQAVKDYQEELVFGFSEILEAYKKMKFLPFEQKNLWLMMSLKKECIYIPKLQSFSESLKEKVVENFGEIVTLKTTKKSLKTLLREKSDLLWVDFVYRLFGGVNFLFIPELYTRVIFLLKYLDLKLRLKNYGE